MKLAQVFEVMNNKSAEYIEAMIAYGNLLLSHSKSIQEIATSEFEEADKLPDIPMGHGGRKQSNTSLKFLIKSIVADKGSISRDELHSAIKAVRPNVSLNNLQVKLSNMKDILTKVGIGKDAMFTIKQETEAA